MSSEQKGGFTLVMTLLSSLFLRCSSKVRDLWKEQRRISEVGISSFWMVLFLGKRGQELKSHWVRCKESCIVFSYNLTKSTPWIRFLLLWWNKILTTHLFFLNACVGIHPTPSTYEMDFLEIITRESMVWSCKCNPQYRKQGFILHNQPCYFDYNYLYVEILIHSSSFLPFLPGVPGPAVKAAQIWFKKIGFHATCAVHTVMKKIWAGSDVG